jgi:putative phage-type endonuclease
MTADLEQRTADWFRARAGKATASRFKDVIAKRKDGKGYLSVRDDYAADLVVERLTGEPAQRLDTAAMSWGCEQEDEARRAYQSLRGVIVEDVGFVQHDTLQAGCSPDGLVDWDGLIEIKCPFNSRNHIETLTSGMPAEHMAQVQGQLWITGRDWCDFISFDPRMPPELQLYVQRINRDPGFIADLQAEVTSFLEQVGNQVEALKRLASERIAK